MDMIDAQLVDRSEAQAQVDGYVAFTADREGQHVDGDLVLHDAHYIIDTIPRGTVTASNDVRVTGRDSRDLGAAAGRTIDIDLTLGDDVRLQGFGLDARLQGGLSAEQSPESGLWVTGIVQLLDGEFTAYGQTLEITNGSLNFIGPVDDPGLDIVASRTAQEEMGQITVELVISGTAKDPQTSIRSRPALAEADALAVLLTGRLPGSGGNTEIDLTAAAAVLGLKGANQLAGFFADKLSIEEISVKEGEEGAELGLGARVSSNLYLRYTYSMFSRLGGILLRYELSDRLGVQAVSGDVSSIEATYSFGWK